MTVDLHQFYLFEFVLLIYGFFLTPNVLIMYNLIQIASNHQLAHCIAQMTKSQVTRLQIPFLINVSTYCTVSDICL